MLLHYLLSRMLIEKNIYPLRSPNSSVITVTIRWVRRLEFGFQQLWIFPFRNLVQATSGAPSTSYTMNIGGSFPRDIAVRM